MKRRKKRVGRLILLIAFAVITAAMLHYSKPQSVSVAANESNVSGWELVLVNKDNPVPDDYDVNLTELSNGQSVDSRIYPALQRMLDAMRSDGFEPVVASGYRTAFKQRSIMDDKIRAYRKEGCSYSEAKELAAQWVAQPGTSEHQLGLAVDINEDNVAVSSDEFYAWLDANAPDYGFIKRYPGEKSDITGIANEPWHYRYVGVDTAKQMSLSGECLEEYLNRS